MKNIIPFKKDVIFKTNLNEITSISLEHTLIVKDDSIKGDFIVSGEYKVSENSKTVEPFSLKLPFEIMIDEKYDTKKAVIDIDDFYYEIVNNNVLSISIDVLLDKLEEKPLIVDDLREENIEREILDTDSYDVLEDNNDIKIEEIVDVKPDDSIKVDRKCDIEEEEMENKDIVNVDRTSIFSSISNDNAYVTYNVFILRDGDTIDSILLKYNIDIEQLKKYNDIDDLKVGDKIIIPNVNEGN